MTQRPNVPPASCLRRSSAAGRHLSPKVADPLVRLAPRRFRVAPAGLAVGADGGIRPEELHVRLLALEITQAVGHQLVGHMAFEIDQKAVVTEAALRRTRVQV